jgi:hypothetical protein
LPTPSSFAGAVIERAKATPEINATVGTRVFKGLGPPDTPMPYVEVHEVANPRTSRTTSGVAILEPRVQATICAADDPTTIRLAAALERALAPAAGPLAVQGQAVLWAEVSDDFLAPRDEIAPGAVPQLRRILQIAGVCQRNP